jgi:ribosomal protein L22
MSEDPQQPDAGAPSEDAEPSAPAEPDTPRAEQAPKKPARSRAKAAAEVPAQTGDGDEADAEGSEQPAAEAPAKAKRRPSVRKARAAKASAQDAGEAGAEQPAAKATRAKAGAGSKAPASAPAAKPARGGKPARRRVVRAHARYVRTSARKARMVCVHLRGKSVQDARAILAFTPRDVARDWSKLLESAVANAESNHELLEDDLIVREAYADEGPTIKRFRPRAMGRATPIRKRTSHLTITLTTGPERPSTDRRR